MNYLHLATQMLRAGLLFSLMSVCACANQITWTLEGVTFTDGGTASGSFVFDANLDAYSSINIVTTNGSVFTGSDYTFPDPANAPFTGPSELFMVTSNAANLTGTPFLDFIWTSNLTNAGGTDGFSTSGESSCTSPTCSSIDQTNVRLINGGSITSATVPEPASFLLLGSALAAVGLRHRGRRQPPA